MATVKIEPIPITTRGGYSGEITGIRSGTDLLNGWVQTPGAGRINVSWDDGGNARDRSEDCNISIRDGEIEEAIDVAQKIFGAK